MLPFSQTGSACLKIKHLRITLKTGIKGRDLSPSCGGDRPGKWAETPREALNRVPRSGPHSRHAVSLEGRGKCSVLQEIGSFQAPLLH